MSEEESHTGKGAPSDAVLRLGWLAGMGAAVFVLGVLAGRELLAAISPGPLARHMAVHILFMNALAPVLALWATLTGARIAASGAAIAAAAVVQLALIWGWHAPAALAYAAGRPILDVFMQVSLLAAALWFWLAVLSDMSAGRWRAVLALLLTSKLFCLLGVLLVFAPRALYPDVASAHGYSAFSIGEALADQQLAGLLMLAACPLTYLLAGVVIAARWLKDMSSAGGREEPVFSGSTGAPVRPG